MGGDGQEYVKPMHLGSVRCDIIVTRIAFNSVGNRDRSGEEPQ